MRGRDRGEKQTVERVSSPAGNGTAYAALVFIKRSSCQNTVRSWSHYGNPAGEENVACVYTYAFTCFTSFLAMPLKGNRKKNYVLGGRFA
jgi:hypothetical protein